MSAGMHLSMRRGTGADGSRRFVLRRCEQNPQRSQQQQRRPDSDASRCAGGGLAMEWAIESRDDENRRKSEANRAQWEIERDWHPWFAWFPVEVTPTKRAWLC